MVMFGYKKRVKNSQLQEQLAPLHKKSRLQTRRVTPVSQIMLRISCEDESSCFDKLQSEILKWMEDKASQKLPQEAWNGDSFELRHVGAQHSAAVSLPEDGLWIGRQDDADSTVASRSWVTEFGLLKTQQGYVEFGCRLQCVSVSQDSPIHRTIPKFVKQIMGRFPVLLDGRKTGTKAWLVRTEEDVTELVRLLENSWRKRDVIVVATAMGSEDVRSCLFKPDDLAWRVAGAAHIVVITGKASFLLSNILGKEFSIFDQGVRTYRPGFNTTKDEPFRHPLAFKERISNWQEPNGPGKGPEAFLDWVAGKILEGTAHGRNLEIELPAFTTAASTAASLRLDKAKAEGASDADLLNLALEENQSLRDGKELSDSLLKEADQEQEELRNELQQVRLELEVERHKSRSLGVVIEKLRTSDTQNGQATIPESLDDLENWCNVALSGSVYVHPKALKETRKSNFQNAGLIYQSLLILRDFYVPMKKGEKNGIAELNAFREELAKNGLDESASLSPDKFAEMGETYKVSYDSRRLLLERHLKGNSSRKEHGFRLYFTWDDETQLVVVGWMPTHLDNSLT